MNKILLPNGLQVSPVALGAMDFGTTTSKDAAFSVLDAYLDMGGNFIDTSNNYAHWNGTGDESETLLGEYFASRKCRDRVVLANEDRLPEELVAGERLAVLQNMAKEKSITASALAVAWMVNLHRCEGFPRVIPLFGSSRVEHFVSNLTGAELTLTDRELEQLNNA